MQANQVNVIDHPSPNFGPRRQNARPDLIVLHFTGMDSAEAALARLCDPAAEVSAHYVIREDGRVLRLVAELQRAWHAGAGTWGDVVDVNSRSIGIELVNTGSMPFPEPQMSALEQLIDDIRTRWTIPSERIIGHSDMAPIRKFDPGRRFDWCRLARQGRSVWPDVIEPDHTAAPAIASQFAKAAEGFGYTPVPKDPAAFEALVDAFRQRFRPMVAGSPVDGTDLALATSLARSWPFRGV